MQAPKPSAPPDPTARVEAHWAANVPASVAAAVLEAEPDSGHTALRWREPLGLVSASIDGDFRLGLSLVEARVFVARDETIVDGFELEGMSLTAAIGRLAGLLGEAGGPRPSAEVPLLNLTRPFHPVARGEPFHPDRAQWDRLSTWFGFAARHLERERAQHETASVLRCWPHHFDIAALWTLDEEPDPEKARSIGVGLSPGDESIQDPYFYVLPWPRPEARPEPPIGRWEGGFMVLDAAEILADSNPAGRVDGFLEAGVSLGERLLQTSR